MNSSWRKYTGSLCLGSGHIQFYWNSLCHHGMHYRHHLSFSPETHLSVCFSCLMLQKVSVYPVSFPSGLMRKERLFYLGFSRYIPAAGQAEPKQALSSQGNESCWSLGLPSICCPPLSIHVPSTPSEHFLPCRGRTDGSNHRPVLPCLAATYRL